MNPVEQVEHLLALKVMRLTRPTLVGSQVIACEPRDLPQLSFKEILSTDCASIAGAETLAAGQFMLLPQSFGNIYLGETFSSYICVHNSASFSVEGVTVKVDLQSNTSRINLPMQESKSKLATLGPGETLDDAIRYEVKEIGTHILVCEVNYTSAAGLPQYFRKFFKFQVLKPLDVTTKFYNAEMDEIYLEATILNITSGPFCLEKVELESTEQYRVTPLNTLPNGESVFASKNMLQPNNSCQFLYCIKPTPEVAKDIKALRMTSNVGKLDIVWRSNLGERGRLQTSPLHRLPFEYKDIRLEIIDALNIVKIGEPFTFTCRITNTSDRSMDLFVKLPTVSNFEYSYIGSAEFTLGSIDSGQQCEFPITVCPTRLGLVKVSPIQLINSLLQEEYTIVKVLEVFVVNDDYQEAEATQLNKFVRYDCTPTKTQHDNQIIKLQVV